MIKALFTSKRFWVTVAAVATTAGTYFDGKMTAEQAAYAVIAAVAALVFGYSYRDAGK